MHHWFRQLKETCKNVCHAVPRRISEHRLSQLEMDPCFCLGDLSLKDSQVEGSQGHRGDWSLGCCFPHSHHSPFPGTLLRCIPAYLWQCSYCLLTCAMWGGRHAVKVVIERLSEKYDKVFVSLPPALSYWVSLLLNTRLPCTSCQTNQVPIVLS